MSSQIYQRVRENPKFKELVTRRGRLGGLLSLIVLGCYYAFMAVVAFKYLFTFSLPCPILSPL